MEILMEQNTDKVSCKLLVTKVWQWVGGICIVKDTDQDRLPLCHHKQALGTYEKAVKCR